MGFNMLPMNKIGTCNVKIQKLFDAAYRSETGFISMLLLQQMGVYMERYENIVKIEEIRRLADNNQYLKAVKILDTMDVGKIKALTDLSIIADVFIQSGRYEDAMAVLVKIYGKSKTRRVLYQLLDLSIKSGNASQAEDYLKQYIKAAPQDSSRFIFRYCIDKLNGEAYEVLIASLEQLKEFEYYEMWAYELAKLYHKAGMKDKCVRECSDIILWFGDGIYVEKAKLLKGYYVGEVNPIHMLKAKEKKEAERKLGLDKTKDYSSMRSQIDQFLAGEDIPKEITRDQDKDQEVKKAAQTQKDLDEPDGEYEENTDETADGSGLPEKDHELQAFFKKVALKLEKQMVNESGAGLYWEMKRKETEGIKEITPDLEEEPEAEARQETGLTEEVSYGAQDEPGDKETETGTELYAEEEQSQPEEEQSQPEKDRLQPKEDWLQPEETILQLAVEETTEGTFERTGWPTEEITYKKTRQYSGEEIYRESEPHSVGETVEEPGQQTEEETYKESEPYSGRETVEEPGQRTEEETYKESEPYSGEETYRESEPYSVGETVGEMRRQSEEETTEEISAQPGQVTEPAQNIRTDQDFGLKREDGFGKSGGGINYSEESVHNKTFYEKQYLTGKFDAAFSEAGMNYEKDFGYFIRVDSLRNQIESCLENVLSDYTKINHIIIAGNKKSGKTTLAKKISKALYGLNRVNTNRVAKINAAKLNGFTLESKKDKLVNSSLIIEEAGLLDKSAARQLLSLIGELNGNIFVILEDTESGIEELFQTNPGLSETFNSIIRIPAYTKEDLYGFAFTYIHNKDYEFTRDVKTAFETEIEKIISSVKEENRLEAVMELARKAKTSADARNKSMLTDIVYTRDLSSEDFLYIKTEDFLWEDKRNG